MARSMSGELAMILWAARMPTGNRDPSSRSVLYSPIHFHGKESGNSTPRVRQQLLPQPQPPQGCHLPQGSNRASFPDPSFHPPAGGRIMAHPCPARGLPAAGLTCCCEAPGQGKGQLASSDETHAHVVGGAAHSPPGGHRPCRGNYGARWGRTQSKKSGGRCQARPLGRWPAPISPLPPPAQPAQVCPRPRAGCDGGGSSPCARTVPTARNRGHRERRAGLRSRRAAAGDGSEPGRPPRPGPTPTPGPSWGAQGRLLLPRARPCPTPAGRPLTHRPLGSPGSRGAAPATRHPSPSAPPPPPQRIAGAAARRWPIEGRGRSRGAVASSARPAPPAQPPPGLLAPLAPAPGPRPATARGA